MSQTIFLWWGTDALKIEKDIWFHFQESMSDKHPEESFISALNDEVYEQISSKLENEGWHYHRMGSGGLRRVSSWTKHDK